MAPSMPFLVGNGLPTSRSSIPSVQWRICWRSAPGTPRISQITSIGNGAAKSSTASKDPAPCRSSRSPLITRWTSGSHSAMRRGVKARFTSLRSRSCIGGSSMMIDAWSTSARPKSLLRSWSSDTPWVDV